MARRGGAKGRGGHRAFLTVRSRIPPLVRAFLRYTARHPEPVLVSIMLLEREVEAEIETITDGLFADIESELETAVKGGQLEYANRATAVRFEYDTRLLLPAVLTHGRIHVVAGDLPIVRRWRSVDESLLRSGLETTAEIVAALLDGDMRDALNDDEYADFDTNVRPKAVAAKIAQRTLQRRVEAWFSREETPPAVQTHYRHAVELSEAHQQADGHFRDLLDAYRGSTADDQAAVAAQISDQYKHADPAEPSPMFETEEDLPYFATQYERVGIIYEDMLGMYEADLGIELGTDFKRAIVLMVIAAQVGLDDTDDYPEDRGAQLTPVTAELNLHGPRQGLEHLRHVVGAYLDRAERYSNDHLTGMAIEYIRQQSNDRLDALAWAVRDR